MDDFCKEKGFAKWFETSAKENINIEASSRFLISEVIRRKKTFRI
jgi:Ras-related protein Rab-32